MLQKRDGFFVLPVGLHHHALHLRALDAEHPAAERHDLELLVAFLALVLPHVLVLHVGLRSAAQLLAQLVHLGRELAALRPSTPSPVSALMR